MPTETAPVSKNSLSLNVLGYWDEQEQAWVALALEMDLRGYGPTFEAAEAELEEVVGMQIRFALFKGQPEMMWKPAEPVYWTLSKDLT